MIANQLVRPILTYFIPEDMGLQSEKNVMGLCQLIATCALEAISHYEQGDLIGLDALAGNYGCEANAYSVLHLMYSQELQKECHRLKPHFEAVLMAIEKRNLDKHQNKIPFKEFFATYLKNVSVSDEMGYLIQARLLTITKQVFVDKNGYETEKTDHSLLKRLTDRIDDHFRAEMVSYIQETISHRSVHFLGSQTRLLKSIPEEEKQLIQKMFDASNLCSFVFAREKASSKKKLRPKTYSCAYYNIKAVFLRLRELRTPVVVKKLTKFGEFPQPGLLYRSPIEGGPLVPLNASELKEMHPQEPVMVCEGIIPDKVTLEELAEKINRYGLFNILLTNGAQGSQYVPNHDEIFAVKEPQALAEIKEQIQKAEQCETVLDKEPLFNFVHLYCNTFGKEMAPFSKGGLSHE